MLTAHDNAAIARAHYDAFNGREMNKALVLVTADVKWTNVPFNVRHEGHKGYREFVDNWSKAMPDCRVQIMNLVAGEEWIAVEFVGRGTHTGPLAGPAGTIPATQKKLDMQFCELLRIQDGQIAEAHLYFDAATMMRQLGVAAQTPPQPQPQPQPVPTGR